MEEVQWIQAKVVFHNKQIIFILIVFSHMGRGKKKCIEVSKPLTILFPSCCCSNHRLKCYIKKLPHNQSTRTVETAITGYRSRPHNTPNTGSKSLNSFLPRNIYNQKSLDKPIVSFIQCNDNFSNVDQNFDELLISLTTSKLHISSD